MKVICHAGFATEPDPRVQTRKACILCMEVRARGPQPNTNRND
jgi:hypothetical protein